MHRYQLDSIFSDRMLMLMVVRLASMRFYIESINQGQRWLIHLCWLSGRIILQRKKTKKVHTKRSNRSDVINFPTSFSSNSTLSQQIKRNVSVSFKVIWSNCDGPWNDIHSHGVQKYKMENFHYFIRFFCQHPAHILRALRVLRISIALFDKNSPVSILVALFSLCVNWYVFARFVYVHISISNAHLL